MAKAYKNKQEQEALNPRPSFPNAYDYYLDYYSEEEESTFIVVKDKWRSIKQNNSSGKYLSETELSYLGLCNGFLQNSKNGKEHFGKQYLCNRLKIHERQLRTVRNNTSHIFPSKWRKVTKTPTGVKKNVYAITASEQATFILNEPKYYKSIKLGSQLPTSIYKDENIYIKDRSIKSNFSQGSIVSIKSETTEFVETKKIIVKKTVLANSRKKPTNQERKAKIYSPKFKQYDKPKNLSEHYPLTTEECSELQSRSGREFTLNAMNEILLDMSRKPNESKHKFPSKAAFMAYMSKVYRYEGRDAVKTANTGFKIVARATEAEIIQHTTQTERESYLNLIEQQAITHRSDENQLKAKWANTLPTNAAYNLLSNMRTVQKVGKMLQVLMDKEIELTEYSREIILAQANAVGVFMLVERLEVLVK